MMMHSLCFVLILFTGYMSSIASLRLPPVGEYSYRGRTSVELLTLVHPPSYRHRRSDDCTPDHLSVRFTADQQVVELLLQRNYDIDVNAPLFVNRNGTIAQEILKHSENVAVYQDLESGSAVLVECIPSTRKFELFGTFYNGSEELMIEPEGQEEFPATSLNDGQSRETKSKSDVLKTFSISHHAIYKGKTPRPKLSDFIEEAGLHPKYQAGTSHSARVKRADTAYQIELLMVADHSAYKVWLEKSSTDAEAKELLRQFYAFVLNGMDLRYKSVTGSGFSITILFAGLYIAETPLDALWTESRRVLSDFIYQVNASAALNGFQSWIQFRSNLSGHDHAMLFTAYDLLGDDGNNSVAGMAYLNATCTNYSLSIVEDHFDATMITVAAHELGHSLGAMHDGTLNGTGNSCFPTLSYIMAASVTLSNLGNSGFQYNKNLWKFSPCSISYFQAYINTLSSNNCMTTLNPSYNSSALSPYDQQHSGQVYSADTQCLYTRGPDSYLCRNIYDGNYTNMCAAFYCKISGSISCASSIAAERTACGYRKWCVAGECLAAAEAPSVNESCPFGNQPGIVADGLTCAQLVANSTSNCYRYADTCCGSCQNAYTGITGCGYGDKVAACSTISRIGCYNKNNEDVCCRTCRSQKGTIAGCEYGDKLSGCNAGDCAFYDSNTTSLCCETCYVPTTATIPAVPTNTTTTAAHTTTPATEGRGRKTIFIVVRLSFKVPSYDNFSDGNTYSRYINIVNNSLRDYYTRKVGQDIQIIILGIRGESLIVDYKTVFNSTQETNVALAKANIDFAAGETITVGGQVSAVESMAVENITVPIGGSSRDQLCAVYVVISGGCPDNNTCVVFNNSPTCQPIENPSNNCTPGTYQDSSLSVCMPCVVGTYQPRPGQTTCIQCPTGTHQPNITSTECYQCRSGSYQNETGSASCIPCPSGTYQSDVGQTSCIKCAIGTYQPNINTSERCRPCDPGSYQKEIGSSSCVLCEVGTYQPYPGKSACVACTGGTYQSQNGSKSCDKCDPGSYQNKTGGSSCIPCAEGYYNSIAGDESCRPCEIGTFQNSTGQSFCFPCPKEYTTEKEGERSVRACFQGYCPEYKYAINISTFTISGAIPPTRINQTGYSWNRCKNDSSKALVSAFCQSISRNEVNWTRVQMLEECVPGQPGLTSPISAQLLNISKMDVNENNLLNILQETNKLIQLQEVLTYVDVGYIADILGKVNTVDNISKEVLNATLDTVNILLESNSSIIQIAPESPGDANRILKTIEDITNKVEVDMAENPVKIIKRNIASSVWEQVGDRLIGVQLLHGNDNFIQNNSLTHLQQEPPDSELLDAAIYFQSDVLNGTKNKLGMTIIWNDALFKTGSERYKVVSKIMAAKLFQNGVSITHLGQHYIKAVFLPTEEDSRVVCGYWDYTFNQNGGGWVSDGCNHTIDKKRHICTCNHLTNFAVLVDLDATSIPPEQAQVLEIITFVGLILSIIGLSLTVLTFLCFRHLRRGRGQQTLFCLCIPMLFYSIIFLVGIKRTEYYIPCIVVSVLIHYFILAAFMWMLMEGVLQYLRFVKILGTYIPNFLIKTSIPAWGIPLVPVIVLLAYDYNLYYGGLGFCWMKLEALYYAFVLPICLIILVNAIIFVIVIFQIFRRPKGMKINQSEWKMTVLSLQAALSIFVVLGLTWIFGVVALGGAKLVFQYIFVILNAFQGFFIFLLFTAREKQVRDQWGRFCCRKPAGHLTSYGQNSSSQDTFSASVSGRNQSSSMTDNRERGLSSSIQGPRKQSNLSQEQIERVQDHGGLYRSTQEHKLNCQLSALKEKEEPFISLQHQKGVAYPSRKYMETLK